LSEPEAEPAQLRERLVAERDERRRLAELIHDGPVQHVAALAQMLDAARLSLDAGDVDAASGIVARALEVARETSVDLRDVAAGLEPEALHEAGFEVAVRELAERVAGRRGVTVELELAAGDRLGEGARSGLYQIVRESLDQAVRRGPPTAIRVLLRETAGGGVELEVGDDGSRERRQAVLDGLAERAAELNGAFAAERTEHGTTIRVSLPPSAARL
jgi:two-component system NarL family sensor kinase